MRPSSSAWIVVLTMTTACGRSGTTNPTGKDGGAPDAIFADVRLPDAVALSDGDLRDAVSPDAGILADVAQPDARDLLGTDAIKVGPEVGSDAIKASLDGKLDIPADVFVVGDVGDAPRDGAGPEADVPPIDAATTTNEIALACALAASCSGYSSPMSASRCIQEFGKTASRQDDTKLDHLLTCASKALADDSWGCGAFTSCWGGNLFTLDDVVLGGACSGKEISVEPSGPSARLTFDCTVLGQECLDLGTGLARAGCALPACMVSPVLAPSCDGAVASACVGYAQRTKLDCSRSGRACQIGNQSAACVGTGVACAATEKVTCVGSQASYCSSGARATVDCAANSPATRCAAGASSEPCAVAGTACDPTTFVDVCDRSGLALDVCLDGTVVKVQCSDIGLVVCTSLNGERYARCEPGI